MASPSFRPRPRFQPRVELVLYPNNLNDDLELHRSAGSTASTAFGVYETFDPRTADGVIFVDFGVVPGTTYYYKGRAIRQEFTASAFTPVVSASPIYLDDGNAGRFSPWEGRRRVDTIRNTDGILKPGVTQTDGAADLAVMKGFQTGTANGGKLSTASTWQDGSAVTFGVAYQDVPTVRLHPTGGTVYTEPSAGAWTSSSAFASTARQFVEFRPVDVSKTGFTPRARLVQRSTSLTNRTAQFSTATNITTVGGNTTAQLTNAPSYNDEYTVQWRLDLTLDTVGTSGTVNFKAAVDSNTTGGWVERGNLLHTAGLDASTASKAFVDQSLAVNVVGAGTSDELRLRAKSFTVTGTATTADISFVLHGYTGTTASKNGVTYQTASTATIYAPMNPSTDDVVTWEAYSKTAATT